MRERPHEAARRRIASAAPGTQAVIVLALGGAGGGLAVALSLAPAATLRILGALALLAALLAALRSLALWQKLTFFSLAGFVVLNYGFTNWTPLPGKPVPAGHLLLLAALPLALRGRKAQAAAFVDEPAVLWWLLLVGLSVAHLVFDVPRYGTYAVRDASFVFEGLFMVLGFLWARQTPRRRPLLVALAVLFLLNAVYALTYTVADRVAAISPVSGIFKPVPLLGSYSHTDLVLVAGGLYYLLVVPHLRMWPQIVTLLLAATQAAWSLVFQGRAVYIGTTIAIALLMLLGGLRRGARAAGMVVGSLLVFFLLLGLTGSVIQGRIGQVGPDFLWRHINSLFLDPNAPAEGTVQWRLDLLSQLRERWTASTTVEAIGEGFGQPLIDFENAENTAVRQPHSTHISVLIRLGTLGLMVWLMMHWRILRSLRRSLRSCPRGTFGHDFALWLLLFWALGLAYTTFQPWLEFSYGAVPFYFFTGLALGTAPPAVRRAAPARAAPAAPGARLAGNPALS